MRILALLILLAPVVNAPDSKAQPLPPLLDEYHVRAFDSGDGLPASYIIGLAQTPDDYLYVATAQGLARFDGYAFHRVALPGFQSNYIEKLYKDQQERLWILTKQNELGYFEEGNFHRLPSAPVLLHDFSDTSDGTVWLGSDSGLIRVMPEADTPITHFTTAHGLPSDSVSGVFDLPDGQRVIVTQRQLALVEEDAAQPGGLRFVPFGPSYQLLTWVYNHVRVDAKGLWLGLRDHVLRYHEGRFTRYGPSDEGPALHIDSLAWTPQHRASLLVRLGKHVRFESENSRLDEIRRVRRALLTSDGTRWVSVIDGNPAQHNSLDYLVRQRGGQSETISLRSYLDFVEILHLLEDHEGSLWVGTDRGLIQLSQHKVFAVTERQGLAEGMTMPVLQTRDGAVWVGTWGGGLYRFADGRLANHYNTANGLPYDQVRALYEARDGTLWVGMRSGLAALRDGRLVLSEKMQGHAVQAFAETPDGTLWIGAVRRLLFRTPQGFTDFHRSDVWHNNAIWALHTARDGALWIGSERGLFRLAGDSLHTFNEADGLRGPYIVSIYEESDGMLWFGTYEHGLHRYRDGRFAAVTTREGLYRDSVWRMLEDGQGGVWMSSDQGIFRVDHAKLHLVADAVEQGKRPEIHLAPLVFTEAEGMPSRECNRAFVGGWRLRDGRLVFNNLKGVVVIDPVRATEPPPSPRTVLQGVFADGHLVTLHHPEIPKLPADTKQLSFDFVALSFIAPEQNRYRYRLDGYDDAWVEGSTQRRASYTNLPPGRYTFRVQGASGASAWREPGAAYTFTVQPSLWQTWWFRLLAAATVVGLLVAAYHYRVDHLLEMERLRLRIASDLHDDVGSSLSSIALLSEMLQGHARLDDLEQRQLQRINSAAEETIGALRDIIWLVDPKHDNLADLVRKMRSVAADFLNGIAYTFEVSEPVEARPLSMTFMRNAFLIYKEALHNIVKHARARRVAIEISNDHGLLALKIRDDGAGFKEAEVRLGHGLENMRRRARQAGGRMEIVSAPGQGTQITFSARMA